MPTEIAKVPLWFGEIEDRPGAAAEKLRLLAEAGADLQFMFARRRPEKAGTGLLFVAPVRGRKQEAAARESGFLPSDVTGVRVEGADKPGLGHRMTEAVAAAGVSLRGFTAAVMGKKFVVLFAFDSPEDADRGVRALRKVK
ncbi:MAG: amino acid-binding protein [Elusimicrobiota bacterium]